MRRKSVVWVGLVVSLFILSSCSVKPEEGLLQRYFHAIQLKDVATMSTIAIEPISMDVDSWEIVQVSEERVEPAALTAMNKTELELKKKLEDHIGPVMDSEDALYAAKDELENARSGAARAAAKKKVEEAQAQYEQRREYHRRLQKEYNDAKAAAVKEEEISLFSLGAGQLPTIRDLTGTAFSKEGEVKVKGRDGAEKKYRFFMRRYDLRDEALNLHHRGRYIIVKFEPSG